jgi:phage shock protein PspC (stress-responsive transcriptional regulator)
MPATTPPTGPGMPNELRSLRRARDGRILAGVCAGLGPRLQIDPVVLRVVLVMLAVFGGVGALLYAAGWLLVPEEGEDLSFLEQQLGRRRNGAQDNAIVVGGLVVLGIVVFSVPWWGFPWHVPVLLVLSVLGLIALVRRNAGPGRATAASGRPGEPEGGGTLGATAPGSPTGTDLGATSPRAADPETAGSAGADTRPLDIDRSGVSVPTALGDAPTGSWRDAPPAPASFWEQPDPLGLEIHDVQLAPPPEDWTPPSAPSVAPPRDLAASSSGSGAAARQRSWLFAATMAVALLVVLSLALVDRDGDVPLGAYVAGPLGVVGLGLIVGTWFGRARALVATGVVLALALPPVSVVDRWPGGVTDITALPTSAAQIERSYDYGVAEMLLDLRNVRFEDGQPVASSIDVGVGDVRIIVPPEVDVRFRGDVGLGEIALGGLSIGAGVLPDAPPAQLAPDRLPPPDRTDGDGELGRGDQLEREVDRPFDRGTQDGINVTRDYTDDGFDGPGGGELVLDVSVGVGHVEVSRA